MTRQEKINEILEMTKEILLYEYEDYDDKKIDDIYWNIKDYLKILKEGGDSNE